MTHIMFASHLAFYLLVHLMNILAPRNHDSGNMETGIPERKPPLIGLITIHKKLSECQAQSRIAGRKPALHW